MPKIKTNRSAAKRFKVSSSGRLKRSKAFKNHILTKKRSKRKADLAQSVMVHESDEKRMQRMLVMR